MGNKLKVGTYSRSASNGMRRGTCCKSRCEQSTVWPVHVQTRGHFWSMLLVPPPPPPPPIAVFAKFVPCTKMPTLPTLLNVPTLLNDESPLPHGINCNSKRTKLVVVAFTTQLSGGFFIIDIISHIYVDSYCTLQLSFVCICILVGRKITSHTDTHALAQFLHANLCVCLYKIVDVRLVLMDLTTWFYRLFALTFTCFVFSFGNFFFFLRDAYKQWHK